MRGTISEVLSAPVVRATINNILGSGPYELVERPGAYVLSLQKEPADRCKRVIILKPKGFTSNSLDELSSHPEAMDATIEIKGAARPAKNGYFPIKNCVEFVHYDKDGAETTPDYPYASADGAFREVKTSRTRFKVVKRNYYGFYHSLVNLTDEWLVLVLSKRLNLSKPVDYSLIEGLGKRQRNAFYALAEDVKKNGDGIFKEDAKALRRVYSMDPRVSLPALITLLNVEEKGRHEQCTVFATILKIARKYPALALRFLKKAAKDETAQPYYLNELLKKVSGF